MTAKGDKSGLLKWVIIYHHNSPNITSHHHPIKDLSLMDPNCWNFPEVRRSHGTLWCVEVGDVHGHRLGVSQRNFTDTPNLSFKVGLIGFPVILNWCPVVSWFVILNVFFHVSEFWIGGFVTEILRHWQFFVAFRFGSVTLYRQPLENWLGLSFFNTLKNGRKQVHDIIDIIHTYPTRQEWGHGQSPGQEGENRTSSLTDDDTSTAPWDSTVCFLKFMDWLQKVSIMSHVILLLVDLSWFIQSDSKLADFCCYSHMFH